MLTAIESANPCASAMPTNPAPLLIGSDVETIAAIPAKHKKKVPMASARNNFDAGIARYSRCVSVMKLVKS
jgi:hypothetical protein